MRPFTLTQFSIFHQALSYRRACQHSTPSQSTHFGPGIGDQMALCHFFGIANDSHCCLQHCSSVKVQCNVITSGHTHWGHFKVCHVRFPRPVYLTGGIHQAAVKYSLASFFPSHSSSQLFLILYLFRLSDLRVPFHHIPLQTQIPLHVSSYWFSFIFFSFHFFHPDLTSQQFLRWLPATLEEKHVVAQAQETDEGGLWCLFPLLVKMSGKNHAGWQVKCAEKWVTEHQLRVSIFYSESLMWKLGHPAVLVSVSLNVEKKKIYSSILGGKNLDKQMVPNWMDQFQITQDGI